MDENNEEELNMGVSAASTLGLSFEDKINQTMHQLNKNMDEQSNSATETPTEFLKNKQNILERQVSQLVNKINHLENIYNKMNNNIGKLLDINIEEKVNDEIEEIIPIFETLDEDNLKNFNKIKKGDYSGFKHYMLND